MMRYHPKTHTPCCETLILVWSLAVGKMMCERGWEVHMILVQWMMLENISWTIIEWSNHLQHQVLQEEFTQADMATPEIQAIPPRGLCSRASEGQGHRRRCTEIAVKRGAECQTDHILLRIKMKMNRKWFQVREEEGLARYDVTKLYENSWCNSDENICLVLG